MSEYVHSQDSHQDRLDVEKKPRGLYPGKTNISDLIEELSNYTEASSLSKRTLDGFRKEYQMLQAEERKVPLEEKATVASRDRNDDKNRYRDVLANDKTRVRLTSVDSPDDDYINANHVKGAYFVVPKDFIASQGPMLGETSDDFWRMVAEQNSLLIVMLTQTWEGERLKCGQYFGNEVGESYEIDEGQLGEAKTLSKDRYDEGLLIRKIELTFKGLCEKRTIVHAQFLNWGDHSVPVDFETKGLRRLWMLVDALTRPLTQPPPIITHCSAGIGRTGCFIAFYVTMLQRERAMKANETFEFDIFGLVQTLKSLRHGMVQSADQYKFIHLALKAQIDSEKESEKLSIEDIPLEKFRLSQ